MVSGAQFQTETLPGVLGIVEILGMGCGAAHALTIRFAFSAARLTEAEWLTLLEVIIIAYQDELARRLDAERHPAPPLVAGGRP